MPDLGCMIGKPRCGEPIRGVILVDSVLDFAGAETGRDGGVVYLCEKHFKTPSAGWGNHP